MLKRFNSSYCTTICPTRQRSREHLVVLRQIYDPPRRHAWHVLPPARLPPWRKDRVASCSLGARHLIYLVGHVICRYARDGSSAASMRTLSGSRLRPWGIFCASQSTIPPLLRRVVWQGCTRSSPDMSVPPRAPGTTNPPESAAAMGFDQSGGPIPAGPAWVGEKHTMSVLLTRSAENKIF